MKAGFQFLSTTARAAPFPAGIKALIVDKSTAFGREIGSSLPRFD